MTTIHKRIQRQTREQYRVLTYHKPRKIVVAFEPGDLLTFREAGCRTKFTLSVERAFQIALRVSTGNMGLCFVPIRKKKA